MMEFFSLWPTALGAAIAYTAFKVIKNVVFHPLSNVPGRKLAAVSRFYEWYWDCIKPGRYCFEIMKMHDEYGPIVRIGPNEVHIADSEWFDVLYSNTAKLDKDPWFYGFLDSEQAAFSTSSYDIHRMKRSKVNPFFSKANVERSEPLLTKVLANMIAGFDQRKGTGGPIGLRNAFKSYAADIVCEFCFPESMEYVKADDFSASFHKGQEGFARMFPWFRHFPGLATLMQSSPDWMIPYMPKETQDAIGFVKYIEAQVRKVMNSKTASMDEPTKKTIIRELLDSDLPPNDRNAFALEQEGLTFVAAGTATTARALESTFFYILSDPKVLAKLTTELRAVKAPPSEILSTRQLEQLPYLCATVQEALRAVPAVPSRFPRINRTSSMQYGKYVLPPGTVIGMSNWDVLGDEKTFKNADKFAPERWLDPTARTALQKYQVAFGKGSRNCVGQNLAMSEILLVLGNVFRRYDIELFETTEKEITIVQDCFVPFAYPESKGVRVVVRDPKTEIL